MTIKHSKVRTCVRANSGRLYVPLCCYILCWYALLLESWKKHVDRQLDYLSHDSVVVSCNVYLDMRSFTSHTEQFHNVTYIPSFPILNSPMPFGNLVKSQRILDWSIFTLHLPDWARNTCLPLYNTHLRPIQTTPIYSPAYGLSRCLELTTLFRLHVQATSAPIGLESGDGNG